MVPLVFLFTSLFAVSLAESNVMDLTPENFDQIVNGEKFVFVEFFAPWCGHCKNLAPEYELVGDAFKSLQDKVIIAKVDADAAENKPLASKYGVSGYPTLKYFNKKTDAEAYEGGRTAADIVKFINQNAKTNAKIQEPHSDVTTLNDKNFESVALDTEKDVLVEFYAPWCGHCKRLAPIYEKVGTTFKSDSNCVIAKIDADSQRVSGEKYGVSGFPTLKFFPKGSTEAEDYSGGREEQDFINFMNEKCGTNRVSGGALSDKAGRLDACDANARKFKNSVEGREAVMAETEKLAGDDKNHKYYHKVMSKVMEKGDEYIDNEIARLTRMLGGALSDEKKDQFTIKVNILRSFLEPETEAETKEEL